VCGCNLIARERGIGPVEDDGGGGKDDRLETDGRDEGHRRLGGRFFAGANRLVDGAAVAHLIVGAQADDVLGVGLQLLDDEHALLPVNQLRVNVRNSFTPADRVAAYHHVLVVGRVPRHRDGTCHRTRCKVFQKN